MASSSIIAVLPTVSSPTYVARPDGDRVGRCTPDVWKLPARAANQEVQRLVGCRSLLAGARQPHWPAVSSGVLVSGGLCVSCRVERGCLVSSLCGVSMRRSHQPCGTTCCAVSTRVRRPLCHRRTGSRSRRSQPHRPGRCGTPGETACRVVAAGSAGHRDRQHPRYARLDRHLNLYETVEAAVTGAATV